MTLKEQLTEDMKNAMRQRDMVKLNTIRFLNAQIKNVEIDQGELDDDGVLKVLQKQVKQMKEAIQEYAKGGRQDLVDDEQAKVAILETYLPQGMSEAEIEAIIDQVLAENEGQPLGPVMGQVMKEVAGRADGGTVSALVKKRFE